MNYWNDLAGLLDGELLRLPAGRPEWLRSAETSRIHPARLLRDLEHGELTHLTAIETAIDEWLETETWPPLDPEAAFYLHCRIETASLMVGLLYLPNSDLSIIPIPTIPPKRVRRWLLIDWWEAHGREEAVRNILCAPGVEEDEDDAD